MQLPPKDGARNALFTKTGLDKRSKRHLLEEVSWSRLPCPIDTKKTCLVQYTNIVLPSSAYYSLLVSLLMDRTLWRLVLFGDFCRNHKYVAYWYITSEHILYSCSFAIANAALERLCLLSRKRKCFCPSFTVGSTSGSLIWSLRLLLGVGVSKDIEGEQQT